MKLKAEKLYLDLILIFFSTTLSILIKSVWSGTTTEFTKAVSDWTPEEVADWARKVLKFSEKSAKILIESEVDGSTLLVIPNVKRLEDYGLPGGPADKLWAEIEKLKKAQANSGMR